MNAGTEGVVVDGAMIDCEVEVVSSAGTDMEVLLTA
jgi:hypothetical protein